MAPSQGLLSSTVIDYVQNDCATPSRGSSHYTASRLPELDRGSIISASRDALARRVDSGSLQLVNEPQSQDAIEHSEFKLPKLSSLFIIIGGNALFQASCVYPFNL